MLRLGLEPAQPTNITHVTDGGTSPPGTRAQALCGATIYLGEPTEIGAEQLPECHACAALLGARRSSDARGDH